MGAAGHLYNPFTLVLQFPLEFEVSCSDETCRFDWGFGDFIEATEAIRLLHLIWRGPRFARQKLYQAREFDGGWVVEVDHDFTHYPGSVQAVMPYELLVDDAHRVAQMRERCYFFRGSARTYTNTVISVYEREKKIQGGIYYPEVLEEELRKVWEQEQTNGVAGTIDRKQ